MAAGPVSGDRLNPLAQRAIAECMQIYGTVMNALVNSGGVALHAQDNDDRALWMRLTALKAANSPVYWNDPEAVATLERLSQRFGAPSSSGAPVFPQPSFGGQFGGGPDNLSAQPAGPVPQLGG